MVSEPLKERTTYESEPLSAAADSRRRPIDCNEPVIIGDALHYIETADGSVIMASHDDVEFIEVVRLPGPMGYYMVACVRLQTADQFYPLHSLTSFARRS